MTTLAQAVLLALSIAVFIYLGVALFKAEWF
jgi:K+-transporting ATPase KdpF subunit